MGVKPQKRRPIPGLLTEEYLAMEDNAGRILLTKNHASRSQGGKTSLAVDRYGRGET